MEKTIKQLPHDNARPHTAAIIQQFLAKKGVAPLSHFPSSPDLSPLYASIEEIQKSVTVKLKAFPISDFTRAMKQPEHCANVCIRVSGDYFE